METILTAKQAKAARDALRLSQGKVASEVGINRTYLSLFESGKYVFEDDTLSQLRDYYEEQGFEFNSEDDSEATTRKVLTGSAEQGARSLLRVKDGFVVPDAMSDEDADALLTEYQENRHLIQEWCGEKPNKGIFSAVDEGDLQQRQQNVTYLMARNYTLIEQLQGHTPFGCDLEQGDDKPEKTIGELLSGLFQELFEDEPEGARQPEKESWL